jgi:hypothetical protein
MSNFLTIDLDYFTMTKRDKEAIPFIIECMKVSPETWIIDTHEKVVEFDLIPQSTTKVINVDFHNDITIENANGYGEMELNEGTWGNYLHKNVKEFMWHYPSKLRCITDQLGLCEPCSKNPADYPLDYKKQLGYHNIPKVFNRLVICLSSQWGNPTTIMEGLGIPNWDRIRLKRIH